MAATPILWHVVKVTGGVDAAASGVIHRQLIRVTLVVVPHDHASAIPCAIAFIIITRREGPPGARAVNVGVLAVLQPIIVRA